MLYETVGIRDSRLGSRGLNPYYVGRCSMSILEHPEFEISKSVLILIMLEDAL